MNLSFIFFFNSIALGIGLSMDAFSVSLANGMSEPMMSKRKTLAIPLTFALFQMLMPLIGFICVHTIVEHFRVFEKFIPYIALVLLCYIGGKMLLDSIKNKDSEIHHSSLGLSTLIIQGVATSIDALSVGFTISKYDFPMALLCAVIIAVITFLVCLAGLILGKNFGAKFAHKATVFGGIILIAIGIEIFITGIL